MPGSIKSLQGEEKTATLSEFMDKAVIISWHSLVQSKNPEQMSGVKTLGLTEAPVKFSEPETIEIDVDMRRADLDIKLMKDIERDLGNLWPEKGVVEHGNYEKVKALLKARKGELIAQYCTYPGWNTAVFEQLWPFDY